jgi:hypothetical protein
MRSDATPADLPRKKPNILWWIGGIVTLVVLWLLYQVFGPSPRIVVSKQTTYLTEPLDRRGLPDYEKYVLDRYRAGVTHENNAAAPLLSAMWPAGANDEQARLIAAELGLDVTLLDPAIRLVEAEGRKAVSDWQMSLHPGMLAQATGKDVTDEEQQNASEKGELTPAFVDPSRA